MDIPALATEAAALLAGYALAIGQDVADKTKTAVADRLLGLVKDKLARRADDARALEDLMREPADGSHQEAVAAALTGAIEEDPSFGERLRRTVAEVKQTYGDVVQTATATGPVAGSQIVSNFGPGVSVTDSIVNNQGSVDQSVHTTHKRGGRGLWLLGIAAGLVIAGVTTLVIVDGPNERIQGSPKAIPPVGTTSTTRPPATPAADPPWAVSDNGVGLGQPLEGRYALLDNTAYFVDDEAVDAAERSLVAVELATGQRRWSMPVEVDDVVGRPEHAVEAVDVDGTPMVFLVAPGTSEGTGTSVDRTYMRLTAVDAADGRTAWTHDYGENVEGDVPAPVFSASHVVIADGGQVTVLEPSTGDSQGSWEAPHFVPELTSGEVVVGIQGERPGPLGDDTRVVAGRSVNGGGPLWTVAHPHDGVIPLGQGLAAVVGTVPDKDPASATHLVEVPTGRVVAQYDHGYFAWFDGEATIVFKNNDFYSFEEHAFAVDIESREILWELPDEAAGRIAPDIVDARKGAVYATTGNGSLILDARTGEDKVTGLPVTPDKVTAGYVLAFNTRGNLFAFPATA